MKYNQSIITNHTIPSEHNHCSALQMANLRMKMCVRLHWIMDICHASQRSNKANQSSDSSTYSAISTCSLTNLRMSIAN